MSTTQNVILDELAQAIAATLNVAIPAFSQVGMIALFGAIQNLITHHSNAAANPKKEKTLPDPSPNPNPAPILSSPNPAPVVG